MNNNFKIAVDLLINHTESHIETGIMPKIAVKGLELELEKEPY